MSRPFYLRGMQKSKPTQQQRSPQQQRPPQPPQQHLVQVRNDLYAQLLGFLHAKYNQERITRRGNFLCVIDAQGLVADTLAEIRSPEAVAIYVTDSASGRENKFDSKIEDLEIPAPITVPREVYGYLRQRMDAFAGAETFRHGNNFYTADGTLVAELLSPEKVMIGGQENIIADLKPAPNIEVSREFYGHLRRHIDATTGKETYRQGNNFYTEDGTLVAELISHEKVRIYTQIRTGLFEKTTTIEIDIASLKPEIAPIIEVSREFYGYLRRHIAMRAGAETFRRGNNFYTEDGTLVAELLSPEKARIHTPTGSNLFAKTATAEIDIASLKPKRIYIPRELLYITKKLFGSYRRFDRGVRMDRNQAQSSRIGSLGLPECAAVFFGKATEGLIEDEVKYLINHWAHDISNKRRAHTSQVSNAQPIGAIYLPAPPRSAPMSPLVESAEIAIDGETLTIDERLEAMQRLGLDQVQQQQTRNYVPSRRQTAETGAYSKLPSSHAIPQRHELRNAKELEKALRIEAAQNAPSLAM